MPEQGQETKETFDLVDMDYDGKIDYEVISDSDDDDSGTIDYGKSLKVMTHKS